MIRFMWQWDHQCRNECGGNSRADISISINLAIVLTQPYQTRSVEPSPLVQLESHFSHFHIAAVGGI